MSSSQAPTGTGLALGVKCSWQGARVAPGWSRRHCGAVGFGSPRTGCARWDGRVRPCQPGWPCPLALLALLATSSSQLDDAPTAWNDGLEGQAGVAVGTLAREPPGRAGLRPAANRG